MASLLPKLLKKGEREEDTIEIPFYTIISTKWKSLTIPYTDEHVKKRKFSYVANRSVD